ncbi:DNA photolyase [Candidatus Sumerlaeota bacterium]|nr:DNA photolyase [Candidatus Sumerlaeota bacterium]
MIRNYIINKALIESGCEELPYVKEVLSRLSGIPIETGVNVKSLVSQATDIASLFNEGKKTLLLMKNRGKFLKLCPGTSSHLCCLYQVLHHAAGCPLDCSYCILQAYLNNPNIVYYANVDDMTEELRERFSKIQGEIFRLGTGEYTDSLALESIMQTTHRLAPILHEFPGVFLELKTKTVDIEAIRGLEPRERMILAWSLNPDRLIQKEEIGAAPLGERLNAASIAQSRGHPVAFHFDPLLFFEGWEEAYRQVVRQLSEAVDISRVFWISLGSFRFPPPLKPVIQKRFPDSRILYEEFIPGEDGKMRYFKPLRIGMYRNMVKWLKEAHPDVFIYLCMERADVWDASLGFHPKNNLDLKRMLDERCISLQAKRGRI